MVVKNVIKRNGRFEPFDCIKLRMSINSARSAVECKNLFLVEDVLDRVTGRCHDNIYTAVLHDIVVAELTEYGCPDVAGAFVDYGKTKHAGEAGRGCQRRKRAKQV